MLLSLAQETIGHHSVVRPNPAQPRILIYGLRLPFPNLLWLGLDFIKCFGKLFSQYETTTSDNRQRRHSSIRELVGWDNQNQCWPPQRPRIFASNVSNVWIQRWGALYPYCENFRPFPSRPRIHWPHQRWRFETGRLVCSGQALPREYLPTWQRVELYGWVWPELSSLIEGLTFSNVLINSQYDNLRT